MNASWLPLPSQAGRASSSCQCPSRKARSVEAGEQAVVEGRDRGVGRLGRPAAEVHRDPHLAAFALPLVEEAQAGREERDHGRRAVDLRRERRRGARLVVVLEKAREAILEVEPGMQVLAHRARRAVLEAVVEPLVVGVVEPLLLQRPLEVPVHLGDEQEPRRLRRGPPP